MKVDVKDYLRLIEKCNTLATYDIEATGLRGDYGSTLCVSIKPYGKEPYTMKIAQHGNDQKLVREVKEELEKYDCWLTYYGKGFDQPFLNTRLLKWGLPPIDKRLHIDLYYVLKYNTLMSRRSMAQYAGLLECHDQKMGVSPNAWSEMGFNMAKQMPTMVSRCESDCKVLEQVYDRTKHLIRDINR